MKNNTLYKLCQKYLANYDNLGAVKRMPKDVRKEPMIKSLEAKKVELERQIRVEVVMRRNK